MRLAYDEISPITKQKSVLVEKEGDKLFKVCTISGYVMNPDFREGGALHKLVGFKDNTYVNFTEGDEVLDPWSRIPTAILRDRVVDKNGDVWLPLMQYNERWCMHPVVNTNDGQNPRWGVSPVTYIDVDFDEPLSNVFNMISEDILNGDYEHPRFFITSIVPLEPESTSSRKVRYFFTDFNMTRWYPDYASAYETFNKLNNAGH